MDAFLGPILTIVAPVFGIIGLGYAATRAELFRDGWIDGLSAYVFRFAIPMLLFSSMARLEIGDVFEWRLLVGYFTGAFATFAAGAWIARRFFARPPAHCIAIGMGGAFSNAVLIGVPMTFAAFGEAGGARIILLIAFHGPLLLTSTAIVMALVRGVEDATDRLGLLGVMRETLADTLRNPILLGVFGGLIWNLADLPFGGVPADIMERLADTAGPCALFAAGASLTRYSIARSVPVAAMMSGMKLVVLPVIVAALCLLVLGVPMESARVAILMAALPSGVNTFLVANYYRAAEGAASSAVVLSTALAVLTVSVVLVLLDAG